MSDPGGRTVEFHDSIQVHLTPQGVIPTRYARIAMMDEPWGSAAHLPWPGRKAPDHQPLVRGVQFGGRSMSRRRLTALRAPNAASRSVDPTLEW